MEIRDQLHRMITLSKPPKRIISLVPSQTELIVDLGLETALVGITKFCVHPLHLRDHKTIVGGTKQVHFDKIRALKPDIILCNKEENTKEMIEELEHIAAVHISDINTLEDAFQLITLYGQLFSKEEKATILVNSIREMKLEFDAFIKEQPKKTVAYFIWKEPWMVAAKQTFIDELMQVNGFDNYYENLERYPEIELITSKPEKADVVLLSSEPFPFKERHKVIVKAFYPEADIRIVDGEMFSWYGSRLLKAFDYFKTLH